MKESSQQVSDMSMVCVVYLLVDGRNSVSKFRESGFHLSYKREREAGKNHKARQKNISFSGPPASFLAAGPFF